MEIKPEILANAKEIYVGLVVKDGSPYRPSNGTEGSIFTSQWCQRCTRESEILGIYCPIFNDAICGQYPKEWIYHQNKPICTKFKAR